MVRSELSEVMRRTFALHLVWEVLSKTAFKFLYFKEAVPVFVEALDCSPDLVPVVCILV